MGSAADEIIDVADELAIDLVAMSPRGRNSAIHADKGIITSRKTIQTSLLVRTQAVILVSDFRIGGLQYPEST